MDLLLLLVIVLPLLFWNAVPAWRSHKSPPQANELSPKPPSLEIQEAPEARPHRSPGP
jgi:hypothetical protein